MTQTILIWDDEAPPPPSDGWTTVLWSGFPTGAPDEVSLPLIVEDRADELRARFLAWVYEIGETRIGGKAVVEHLQLRPGFSYWWMTPLAHTPNYYEASFITDVIKCLAFEDLVTVTAGLEQVMLHTHKPALRRLIDAYCRARGVDYQQHSLPDPDVRGVPPARVRRRLATGWLRAAAAFLRRRRRPRHGDVEGSEMCVFDMLVHLRKDAFEHGTFQSQYWTSLSPMLAVSGLQTTWVHTFFRHGDVPSIDDARELLERFNVNGPATQRHLLLDRLTVPVALSAAWAYARLAAAALRLRRLRRSFTPAGSKFDFWPLFRRVWLRSLTGPVAVRNCLTLAMYERLLSALPYQSTALYIQENQPWEMALLHAWRSGGHGRIIGVPHTTVRFWDLRYHYDPRTYVRAGRNDLPRPDSVALNGPAALREYVTAGYPRSEIREVEALRYLHVQRLPRHGRPSSDGTLVVLICGDNIPGSNERLLNTVAAADALMPRHARYLFKAHKVAPLDVSRYPLDISVSASDLTALFDQCDVVVTGNTTSAAVDAYIAGVPVASMSDGVVLNASPFRGLEGVAWFHDAKTLAGALLAGSDGSRRPPDAAQPFFHLERELPRWRQLLSLEITQQARQETAAAVDTAP